MKLAKIIASSLILLVGIGLFVICFITKNHDNRIKRLGFITSAVVVDIQTEVHEHTEGRPGRGTLVKEETNWGIYKFVVGKTSYLVRSKTSDTIIGKKTMVYYNPKDPGKEYVLESDKSGFAMGITVAFMFLIPGLVLSYRSCFCK